MGDKNMLSKFSTKHLRSQRGAMFGLDARIALAIFAGLSVIAGMAVFGTIRQTDVTSLVSEFDNIGKGYINYAFDTGVDVTPGATTGLGFAALYEDTPVDTLGWNGPYITRATKQHPRFGQYDIVQGRIDTDAAPPASVAAAAINGAWVELTEVPCEIANDLDSAVDGDTDPVTAGEQLDPTAGNLRHSTTCAPGSRGTVWFLLSRLMS